MESGLPTSGTGTDSVWRVGRSLSHSDAPARVHRTEPVVRHRAIRAVAKCVGCENRNAPIADYALPEYVSGLEIV